MKLDLKIGKLYRLGKEFEYINSQGNYGVMDSDEFFILLEYQLLTYPDFVPIEDEYRLKILTRDGNIEYIFISEGDCCRLILEK